MPDPALVITDGPDTGREFPITRVMRVGRGGDSDIVLADSEVSTTHASFEPVAGGMVIEDLGSTNGTFVNGQRITAAQRLKGGDQVRVGTTTLEVRVPAPAPPPPPPPTPAPAAAAPPPAATASPQALQATRIRNIPTIPVLAFVAGPKAGSEIYVGGPVVLGRDPGAADVALENDAEVSRRHATIMPAGGGITVQDLGSTNGTFVNGRQVVGTIPLSNGDKVEVGGTIIEVRMGGAREISAAVGQVAAPVPGAPPNDIRVEGLVKEFNGHRAVDGISLYVNPGEIYGFLGPNGAGKSTTVLMLTTLLQTDGGSARIAGFDIKTQGPQVRASIGVALQAAALDDHLNAWEHMDLQTTLQGLPKGDRKKRGQELLERVGLTEAADRPVGGYSGGMKRRLDLALALVHWPRVLFLDEPTTGLDPQSRTALWEEVARLVKEEGMTVFLTTQYLEEADIMADRVGIIDHGEIVAEDTPAALKAEIGRPTVEVTPVDGGDWAAVSEVLQRFGELVSSAQSGVAVRLKPGVDDLADVIRGLDAAGLRVSNVQLHAPTLDDVFLAKTGRSLEGAAEEAQAPGPGVLDQLNATGVPGAPSPGGS